MTHHIFTPLSAEWCLPQVPCCTSSMVAGCISPSQSCTACQFLADGLFWLCRSQQQILRSKFSRRCLIFPDMMTDTKSQGFCRMYWLAVRIHIFIFFMSKSVASVTDLLITPSCICHSNSEYCRRCSEEQK